jgi:hypothetical protein
MVFPKPKMTHRVSTEIQSSVTTNYYDVDDETDNFNSSDDEQLNVKRATKSMSKKQARGEAQSIEKEEKGEEDVVRLAVKQRIEVKAVATKHNNNNNNNNNNNSGQRTTTPVPEMQMGRGASRDGSRGLARTGTSQEEDEGNDSEDSDCAPMDKIAKSPYELGLNAEKGVKVFAEMRNLLSEYSDNFRTVDPKAAKIFGPTNAWCLVKANGKCCTRHTIFMLSRQSYMMHSIHFMIALIDKSGIVYSQEWTNGNIRGDKIVLPKDLLLLCLVAKRFAKAGELLLWGVLRDLDVYSLVKEALKALDLEDSFKKIASCQTKHLAFNSLKRDCYKCELFVARAFSCVKAFGMDSLDDELLAKIKRCLEIMESRMPDLVAQKKRKKTAAAEEPPEAETQAPPPKKKRGRPAKTVKPEPIVKDEYRNESQQAEPEVAVASHASASISRSSRSSKTGKKDCSSLAALVARFEEQYQEMGETYEQMGETLAELKSKVEENRESTEREIRSELLKEVQQTIMSSFK